MKKRSMILTGVLSTVVLIGGCSLAYANINGGTQLTAPVAEVAETPTFFLNDPARDPAPMGGAPTQSELDAEALSAKTGTTIGKLEFTTRGQKVAYVGEIFEGLPHGQGTATYPSDNKTAKTFIGTWRFGTRYDGIDTYGLNGSPMTQETHAPLRSKKYCAYLLEEPKQ